MVTVDSPLLFLPPHPPVQVRSDRALIIGRSRSCDLRLPSGDASRRHAEIRHTTEGYVIQDLDSTNGTLVNGEPVTERILEPGDRIHISGSTITFCRVASVPDSTDAAVIEESQVDAQTILNERPVPGEVFRGELAEIPVFAVLQILEMGRKTGAVMIEGDAFSGYLWLANGRPIHAETKSQKGFDAAVSLVNRTSPLATRKLTSSTAVIGPNVLDRCSISIMRLLFDTVNPIRRDACAG